MDKNWFEVDKEGLKELQAGKPKHYILRELVQNCFDEPIKECNVDIGYTDGMVIIKVADDSPIGFRDLTHSYNGFAQESPHSLEVGGCHHETLTEMAQELIIIALKEPEFFDLLSHSD